MTLPVLLIRPADNDVDREELSRRGISVVECPLLRVETLADAAGAMKMIEHLVPGHWLTAVSGNAIRSLTELVGVEKLRRLVSSGVKCAAVGEATAQHLVGLGAEHVVVPERNDAAALADALVELEPNGTAVIPKGNLAMATLPSVLRTAGWTVYSEIVYRILEITEPPEILDQLEQGDFAAIVVRSPSAARALARWVGPSAPPVVCAGQTTAIAIREAGMKEAAVARSARPKDIADAVAAVIEEVTRA
ncbi:MAG: uroporphyrinogen-III synthase [Actinomycetota bacterium]